MPRPAARGTVGDTRARPRPYAPRRPRHCFHTGTGRGRRSAHPTCPDRRPPARSAIRESAPGRTARRTRGNGPRARSATLPSPGDRPGPSVGAPHVPGRAGRGTVGHTRVQPRPYGTQPRLRGLRRWHTRGPCLWCGAGSFRGERGPWGGGVRPGPSVGAPHVPDRRAAARSGIRESAPGSTASSPGRPAVMAHARGRCLAWRGAFREGRGRGWRCSAGTVGRSGARADAAPLPLGGPDRRAAEGAGIRESAPGWGWPSAAKRTGGPPGGAAAAHPGSGVRTPTTVRLPCGAPGQPVASFAASSAQPQATVTPPPPWP